MGPRLQFGSLRRHGLADRNVALNEALSTDTNAEPPPLAFPAMTCLQPLALPMRGICGSGVQRIEEMRRMRAEGHRTACRSVAAKRQLHFAGSPVSRSMRRGPMLQ